MRIEEAEQLVNTAQQFINRVIVNDRNQIKELPNNVSVTFTSITRKLGVSECNGSMICKIPKGRLVDQMGIEYDIQLPTIISYFNNNVN